MSKDEDDGDGFSRRGPSPGGDSEWSPLGGFDVGQSSGGAPGKRSLTQGIRAADPRAVLLAKLRTVRGQISGVRDRHLPGMNAAIDAPKPDMDAARGAAIDLGLALGTIDRELAEARELATVLHSDGARAMVEDLARKATDLHAESDPVLALAPPAAQAVPALAAFAAHLFLGGLEANDATETEQRRQWVARLDAHKVRPQAGGAVIDASSRFRGKPGRAAATARPDRAAATIDKPAEYEETRATIDDSPETTLAVAAPRQRDLGRADRSATTIDKPAEYEDTRATIEETPRHEAVERETARSDRAAATIDKPAEYEETRATIDGSARTTDRVVAKQARQPDRPRPDRAAATIDKPAEYEDTRATIDHSPELESADTRPPKESGRPDRAAATIDKPAEWEETRATVDDSPDDDEEPDPDKPGGGRKKRRRGATEVAVQRKQTADTAGDDNHVQTTAAAGVANANAPLPHHDAIQQSFGRHDVSQVRAQVGGEGAAAASAIGAEAYAVGDRAAFAAFPDLHTAAHEAAHTVQQRAGVQLLGGVGATGDRYEQHADRVADAVVAGRSAEPLLDEMAPGKTAASASAGVQRLEAKEQRGGPATEFLHSNTHELQIAVARHLANLDWPAPDARLPWRDQEGFRTALVSRLRSDVLENLTALARLCHPGDPRAVIDEMRGGPKAPLTWMPSIGLAIAQLLEASIRASLRRLGPRWLAAAEQENDSDVQYGWLVTSAPIDEVVGRAMTSGQVFDVQAAPDGATPTKALAGTRHVEIKWQGARSPNLWNWVKAIEPADATTEEIAASLFGSRIADAKSQSKGSLRGLGRGSSLAYRITAAPPLFGLPPELARQFSEAQEHAPHEHSGEPDKAPADVMAAAWSPATAELAMAQAPAASSTSDDPTSAAHRASPELSAMIEQTSGNLVQLNYLVRGLAPWGLTGQIAPAILFLIGKQGAVASMSEEDRAVWQRVFAGQRDNLARIGGAVVQVLDQASALHIDDPSSPEAATLQRILAGYARAASISHLVATSQGLIEQAATQQSQLALIAVQSSARRMDASADYDRAVSGGGEVSEPETRIGRVAARQMDPTAPDPARARSEQQRANRRDAAAYDDKLQDQGIGLQSRLLAGAAVDAAELEDYQLQADARALEHRAHAASVQIVSLLQAAHEAAQGEGGSIASRAAQNLDRSAVTRGIAPLLTLLLSSDFPKVAPRCRQMNKDLQDAVKYLGTARQNYADKRIDGDGYRHAIAKVQEKFQAIAGDEEFAKFLKDGASQVKWQVFRGACIEMAMLVGISIVGGGLAGWVAEGAGAMMATTAGVESVAELSAGARMVMGGTQMVADAAINAAGQTAIQGVSFGDGFLENLMISAGTSVILGDMARAADGVAKADAEGAAMWGKAKRGKAWKAGAWVLNETLAITGHTVMGAALGYVSARLVTGQSHPPPATLQEWLMQGASITVGRYVHKGLEGRSKAFKEFHHDYQPARDLATRTRKLQEKAKQLERGADKHEVALEVLGEHHELLALERQMLEKLTDRGPEGDAAREQAGISMNEADAMSTEVDARLQDAQAPGLAALSMHLGGLEELVPGAVWRGTRDEIEAAVARTGAKAAREETGTWKVTIAERSIEIHERASTADAVLTPDAEARLSSPPPLVGQVDEVTGVEKGPGYAKAIDELRQFYTEMEGEANHVAATRGHATDGPYGWPYAHDARGFSHGLYSVEMRVHLDPYAGVSDAEIHTVKARVQKAVDQYYNFSKTVQSKRGNAGRLHVEIVFVDAVADAHLNVRVMPGKGRAYLDRWFVDGHPTTDAHEIGHGAFGLKDEYHDPSAPGRDTPNGPGVHTDASLMGDYWADPSLTTVEPGTSLKDRHLDEIGGLMPVLQPAASSAPPTTAAAAGAVTNVAPAPDTRAAVARQLAAIPIVATQDPSRGGAITYVVDDTDAARIVDLARMLAPDVQVRELPRGVLIRSPDGEVFFERSSATVDRTNASKTPQGSFATRTETGLPASNVATVEYYGFRGVRTVRGVKLDDVPAHERAAIEDELNTEPLLKFGHVGISIDGGETIWGFTPDQKSNPKMSNAEFIDYLKANASVPGLVRDDTQIFVQARRFAQEQGWSTDIATSVQIIEPQKKQALVEQIGTMSDQKGQGAGDGHGKSYQFPYDQPKGGSNYETDACRNCATFMQFLGLAVPEASGLLAMYIPALKAWAARSPVDQRTTTEEK